MDKLIYKNIIRNILFFFLTSLIIMGLIVWTLQAVKYFDFVSEDGHGFKIYFIYMLLTFPKIIDRIMTFIYFISLFYILFNYEKKNELSIFWMNGITKVQLLNQLLKFSTFILIFQLFLSSYLSPLLQLKARNFLKNSNVNLFSSLIKERKFINLSSNMTIFLDKKNKDNSFNNIFLEDKRDLNSKMIFAKNGYLINEPNEKKFILKDGKIIEIKKLYADVFSFDEIEINLNSLKAKTITVPKIQEINTISLIYCLFDKLEKINQLSGCNKNLRKEMLSELYKRIYKPIFIPLMCLITSYLILKNKNNINYKRNTYLVFLSAFLLILFSEMFVRYFDFSILNIIVCIFLPIILFLTSYYIFLKKTKYV